MIEFTDKNGRVVQIKGEVIVVSPPTPQHPEGGNRTPYSADELLLDLFSKLPAGEIIGGPERR